MALIVATVASLVETTKAVNLWTEPFNTSNYFIVEDSNTAFASDANCPSRTCLILTSQEGSANDSDSGTYIDTKPGRINITGYTNITITLSWHIPSTVSGSYFRFIVYPNGTDDIPILDEVVHNSINTGSNINQTQQFLLGSELDRFPGDELQLQFRTWCDEDDYDDYQTVYVDDIIITGNAKIHTSTPTMSPTSMPTIAPTVYPYDQTVLLNGSASLDTGWTAWSRSNNQYVSLVSSTWCDMDSGPCARLIADSSLTESSLRTPMTNVSDYIDILLEFNVQNAELTVGSEFTVDLITDAPSSNVIASYNKNKVRYPTKC